MRLLLDTHVFLWWLADDVRLGRMARALIAERENVVIVSVVSLWETLVKVRVGKLTTNVAEPERCLVRDDFSRLPIAPAHLRPSPGYPGITLIRSIIFSSRKQSAKVPCWFPRTALSEATR